MKPEECFDRLALPRRLGQAISKAPVAESGVGRARLGEFVDFEDSAPLDPPQPLAQIVGGPYDGEWTANDRDYFSRPDPPPTEFVPVSADVQSIDELPPVVMHRWDYARENPRPCPDSCTVAVFRLAA